MKEYVLQTPYSLNRGLNDKIWDLVKKQNNVLETNQIKCQR